MSFDDELNLMHAAADTVFGVPANFRPASGAPVACTVEKMLPELELALGAASTVVGEAVLKVLKAALPKRPSKGDVFEIGAEDWRVIESAQVEDDDNKRYSVKVERA